MLSPAYIFGWNILDKHLTVGGLFGYSSENFITCFKALSSKSVPSDQNITEFYCMLFSDDVPLTP